MRDGRTTAPRGHVMSISLRTLSYGNRSCNTPFLVHPALAMPTVLSVPTVSVVGLSSLPFAYHSPLALTPPCTRGTPHFTTRTSNDGMRTNAWQRARLPRLAFDASQKRVSRRANGAPPQSVSLPARLHVPISSRALSFRVLLALGGCASTAQIFAFMPHLLLPPVTPN